MAFQAGILNVGGFLGCHRFVSHVTGFATHFGIEIQEANIQAALGMLLVPAFFLLGAAVSGQFIDIQLKLDRAPKYYLLFAGMFFLTAFLVIAGQLGFFGSFGHPTDDFADHLLLAVLCFVCGLQNGMITSVSKSVVRTTHLTGITTDLGIGITRWLNRHRLKQSMTEEWNANFMRAGIILFFGLGSIIGAFVFSKIEFIGFSLPAISTGILFFLTLKAHRRAEKG